MAIERFFPQRAALTATLSAQIANRLAEAVALRGQAGMVVTGGSTPAPLYDALAQTEAPWAQTAITLTDERWVDVTETASNEGLVRGRLLQGHAAAARLVGLKTADATPAQALGALETALSALPQPFDVVILGMGGDAHIASLFPGAPELERAFDTTRPDLVCAIHRPGADGSPERVSLTLRALLGARYIAILIEGEAKLAAYRALAASDDPYTAPVRAILQQQHTPVDIWWAP